MNEEIFIKFLTNRCSREELSAVGKWINKEHGSIHSKIWFKKYWRNLDLNKDTPDLSDKNLLDRTHHLINLRANAARRLSGKVAKRPIVRLGRFLNRAAAILFLPLLVASLFYFVLNQQEHRPDIVRDQSPVYKTVSSPMGNRTKLELADHSNVYLNNGSSLRFPLEFNRDERLVYLIGEAYFEVNADSSRPFIVAAGDIQYRATGTEFNIMAYPEEKLIVATVESGKISIEKVLPDRTVKNYLELDPGQQASYYSEENKMDYMEVDPVNFISWKENRLVMIDDPLGRIATKLERWYNVKIDFEQDDMRVIKYSGTFTNETLTQVLDLMKLATPIDYKIYPRKLKSDGTYSLTRVVIGLKAGYELKVEKNIPD